MDTDQLPLADALSQVEEDETDLFEQLLGTYIAANCSFNAPAVLELEASITAATITLLEDEFGPLDTIELDAVTRSIRCRIREGIHRESPHRFTSVSTKLSERIAETLAATREAFRDAPCRCTSYFCNCRRPIELPAGVTCDDLVADVEEALLARLGRAPNRTGVSVSGADDRSRPVAFRSDDITWTSVARSDLLRARRNVGQVWSALDAAAGPSRSAAARSLARDSVGDLVLTSSGATARVASTDTAAYRVECAWLVGVAIPKDLNRITPRCPCPDSRRWCKHAGAVLYVLAVALDHDPTAFTRAIDGDPTWAAPTPANAA